MKNLSIILISIAVFSCSGKQKADLIVTNAQIYTVDKEFSKAGSFAVKDGKFIAIGTATEILEKFDSDKIIDLNNKFVYPGFIDAHCHFNGYCQTLLQASLRGTKSFDEIIEVIKKHDEKYKLEWVLGRSWDQNDWEVKEFPSKEKLDKLFPNKPVFLVRVDGHAAICNSKALQMAGITAKTSIDGGKIYVEKGEPTGILIDNAMSLVRKLIPEIDHNSLIKAIKQGEQNCFAVGLTSVGDAGLGKNDVLLFDSLHKSGNLKMRINAMLHPSKDNINYFVKKGIFKTDYLNVRSIKIFADGALGSRGAAMIKPYSDDPGNSGLIVNSLGFYDEICKIAYDNNFQVCTHSIGDSANRLILNTYSKFLKGKNDRRWRVEHAQIIHPDDLNKFGEFSIIPSIQATHATSDMYWADERVGDDRIKYAYIYKQLLDQNGWLPNGTDFPVERIEPLLTFYASTIRKDADAYPEGGFQTENALSREETLKSMTIWAAKSAFEENEKGSIEPNKFADFIVLDEDIMVIEGDKIPYVKILKTFSSGEEVFTLK